MAMIYIKCGYIPPPHDPGGSVPHRHVVSDHVKVALPGVELDGETTGVAQGLCKGGGGRGGVRRVFVRGEGR